ncbi:MAG: DUF1501 domain-containing protein, partial [Candidatus Hydrogenedentota bacterium]
MCPDCDISQLMTRRQFFGQTSTGIGVAALASILGPSAFGSPTEGSGPIPALPGLHFAPKAKRVIYMFQNGGPSQLDSFDYKPKLVEMRGVNLPESVRQGQRLTGMTSGQTNFPLTPTIYDFKQYGQSGAWVSETLKHTAEIVDDLCFIKTVNTEAINHDPAITYMQTGHQQPGRPSMGAWLSYGIGSENKDLPSFIVLISQGSSMKDAQALFQRL